MATVGLATNPGFENKRHRVMMEQPLRLNASEDDRRSTSMRPAAADVDDVEVEARSRIRPTSDRLVRMKKKTDSIDRRRIPPASKERRRQQTRPTMSDPIKSLKIAMPGRYSPQYILWMPKKKKGEAAEDRDGDETSDGSRGRRPSRRMDDRDAELSELERLQSGTKKMTTRRGRTGRQMAEESEKRWKDSKVSSTRDTRDETSDDGDPTTSGFISITPLPSRTMSEPHDFRAFKRDSDDVLPRGSCSLKCVKINRKHTSSLKQTSPVRGPTYVERGTGSSQTVQETADEVYSSTSAQQQCSSCSNKREVSGEAEAEVAAASRPSSRASARSAGSRQESPDSRRERKLLEECAETRVVEELNSLIEAIPKSRTEGFSSDDDETGRGTESSEEDRTISVTSVWPPSRRRSKTQRDYSALLHSISAELLSASVSFDSLVPPREGLYDEDAVLEAIDREVADVVAFIDAGLDVIEMKPTDYLHLHINKLKNFNLDLDQFLSEQQMILSSARQQRNF